VVSKPYRFGRHVVGIRTNSEAAGEWLDKTFRDHELFDEEADPYFSLYMADNDNKKGIGKRFHILYKEATDVLKSLDAAEIARRLLWELDSLGLYYRDDGIFVETSVVERNGVTALVPTPILPYIRLTGRKVEREFTLPDVPVVSVDLVSGRLGPVSRQLPVSDAAFADLRRRVGQDGAALGPPRAVPEEVDIICAFHYDPDSPPIIPLSRALAVYYLARNAINLDKVGGRALEPLAKAIEGKRCYLLQQARAAQAYELLLTVLDGDEDALLAAMSE